MIVKLAADIHGRFDELASGLSADDLFIGLGDYLNLVDYDDIEGILVDLLGHDVVASALEALRRGDRESVKRTMQDVGGDRPQFYATVMQRVAESYVELINSIPCRAYLLWGNVDVPHLLQAAAEGNERITVVDSLCIEIGSSTVGMLSGMPPGPFSFGLPGERPPHDYAELLYGLGEVDVLLVHPPPADAELTVDIHAQRDEEGCAAVSAFIERFKPRECYFGHVHQPQSHEKKIHDTNCVNLGYFRKHRTLRRIEL
ncbi:MAG: hypothetical protein P9M14_05365 [Candidatus Alcyoniella australis]|nr:hypothetical protein [Candidatus Alcyoniella australis]